MGEFFSTIPKHVWVPIIVTYACLLPREMTVELAGAALFPYRACLFVFLPFALTQLKHLSKLSIIDVFAAFTASWHIVSLLTNEPIDRALVRGVAQGADFGLAYLIGRATLRGPNDLRFWFLAIIPGLLLAGIFMATESLAGRMILRPFIADLFGQGQMTSVYERFRLGLFRASGPFPHPILAGVFLASTLTLSWYIPKSKLVRAIAVVASLCCVFTVSSATLVALLLCIALMMMGWLQRITRLPLFVLAFAYAALAFIAVSTYSESGALSVFRRYVLLDGGSAAYRELIWQYAGKETLNHPIFGIGLRDWERLPWMSNSVDSYWLVSAMMFGLPMAVAAFLTMAGAVTLLALRCSPAPEVVSRTAFAIGTSLSIIIFSGFSVHLWEGVGGWMLLLTGAGVSLSQWRDQTLPSPRSVRPPVRRPVHPSYGRARMVAPVRGARRR